MIRGHVDQNFYVHGAKSTVGGDAPSVKGFTYFWDRLITCNEIGPGLEFFHAGRCGRCGRALTVPESVASGYGPECAERI